MLMLKVGGALIAAGILGFTLGMLKDYFKLFPPEQYEYVWPFMCGFSAVAGAVVMAFMKPSRIGAGATQPTRAAQPTLARPQQQASVVPVPPAPQGSSEVPGMPTFDFEQAQAAADAMAEAQQERQ